MSSESLVVHFAVFVVDGSGKLVMLKGGKCIEQIFASHNEELILKLLECGVVLFLEKLLFVGVGVEVTEVAALVLVLDQNLLPFVQQLLSASTRNSLVDVSLLQVQVCSVSGDVNLKCKLAKLSPFNNVDCHFGEVVEGVCLYALGLSNTSLVLGGGGIVELTFSEQSGLFRLRNNMHILLDHLTKFYVRLVANILVERLHFTHQTTLDLKEVADILGTLLLADLFELLRGGLEGITLLVGSVEARPADLFSENCNSACGPETSSSLEHCPVCHLGYLMFKL